MLRTFRDTPLKNWASHPADAYQVVARAWRILKGEPEQPVLREVDTRLPTLEDVLAKQLQ